MRKQRSPAVDININVYEAARPCPYRDEPHWHDHVHWSLGPVSEVAKQPSGDLRTHHHQHERKGTTDMSFTLKDTQEVTFRVTGKDVHGHDTALTGTPVFAVDDPATLTLLDNGDGSGKITSLGVVGIATLTVNDAETDGNAFIGSVAIDVISGAVSAVAVTLDTPTEVVPAP